MEGPASVNELGARLESDYRARLEPFGARLAVETTPTEVRLDVILAGQTSPALSTWVQYARRLGWAAGAVEPFRDPLAVEKELRAEMDRWISAQPPKI
jgi:hypothetical protein